MKPTEKTSHPGGGSGADHAAHATAEGEFSALLQGNPMVPVLCHDLRSPLSSIVMGAGLIQRSLGKLEGMPSEKRVIESILRSASRLSSLITMLHDLAELYSGSFELDRARVDTATLVNAAIDAYAPLAAKKEVPLRASSPLIAALVDCDKDRIVAALGYLIDNAVRYAGPAGGVRLDVELNGSTVTFSVSDDGPGMSAERAAHAFDPRWHAAQSPRDGTGLGLALVKGIAVAHGGDAQVASAPGGGTRASFSLPAAV